MFGRSVGKRLLVVPDVRFFCVRLIWPSAYAAAFPANLVDVAFIVQGMPPPGPERASFRLSCHRYCTIYSVCAVPSVLYCLSCTAFTVLY